MKATIFTLYPSLVRRGVFGRDGLGFAVVSGADGATSRHGTLSSRY